MTCQHAGCQCTETSVERDGRNYCSDECAAGEGAGAGRGCNRGHADCGGAA